MIKLCKLKLCCTIIANKSRSQAKLEETSLTLLLLESYLGIAKKILVCECDHNSNQMLIDFFLILRT